MTKPIKLSDAVRERVALRHLVGSLHVASCPFCDDDDERLFVNDLPGHFECHECGATGDLFDWTMRTRGIDFSQALRELGEQAGSEISHDRH